MAQINKNPALIALPSGIKRGVAAALDSTSIWYSYDLMAAYAQGGEAATAAGVAVTSYVGQILTLVDETNKKATAYIIMDAEGTLQEVGSATLGDEKTISLTNDVLGLKNWGIEYYAYNTETGEHVKQVVDESHPWLAGLQPRATTVEDDTIEIAWYQPSTTIEDVSSIVNTLQTSVSNLSTAIGSSEDTADKATIYGEIAAVEAKNEEQDTAIAEKLPLAGGIMTGDITLKDGSIAASETVVDTKITAAIGSAGHLKREIVEILPETTDADPDTIYMVLNTAGTYNEYILINGAYELIGDTQVDLTPYMKKVEGATANNFAVLNSNGEVIDGQLNADSFVPASHLEGFVTHVTDEERAAWNAKVDSTNETYVSLANNAEKLANLPEFSSIGTGLEIVDGILVGAQEYELPVATDSILGGVMVDNKTVLASAEGVLSVQVVAENGLSVGENGITLTAATVNNAGAMTAEQATKLANIATDAQVNVIEGALLGADGEEVDIDENKKLVLPVADTLLGLVKSSEANNQVKVETNGTMSINKVAINKLYLEDGDELILNCGNAFGSNQIMSLDNGALDNVVLG